MNKLLLAVLVAVSFVGVGLVARADDCDGQPCAVVPLWMIQGENDRIQAESAELNTWFNSYRAGVLLPTPTAFASQIRVAEFLKSDEAAKYNPVPATAQQNMVSRNANDDFFLDGRHIELAEFKQLRINADWVARGATVRLSDVAVR